MKTNKRIEELVKILNEAAEAYEQEDISLMSDYEYDRLYDELKSLESETGVSLPNSPTQRVGYEIVSNLTKVRHDSRMLSLDKTKETEKLKSFLQEATGILSWKLDGLTIVVKYNEGRLVQALTRGNGEIGEDVTHNAKVFKNLPTNIDFKSELVIRGEAIISFSEFEKINKSLGDDEKYKNPRNLCSGTVRQLNSRIAAERKVEFIAFQLVTAGGEAFEYKSDQLEWLKKEQFTIVEYKKVTADNIEDSVEEFQSNILKNDFASDGLVLTYDDTAFSQSLGTTSKFPKDSIAFKWADETSETKLLQIIWNTSRTGLINPIAIFEPVELEGTTVEKASLHNLSIVEGLALGVGDTIKVYKANMIIPQVAENLTRSGTALPPVECPVCHSATEIKDMNNVKTVYCSNPNCHARLVRTLTHYTSRDALNIEGFSQQTVEKFIKLGYINNYCDIYALEQYAEEIKATEGFGVKSYEKLIASIEKSKATELPNFIYGLGIDNVGLSNAKLLCKNYNYELEKIRHASTEELVEIEGFGEIIAESLAKYFSNAENLTIMDKTLAYLQINKPEMPTEENLSLSGKTFVITGEVTAYKNRKELQEFIEKNGGKVTGSVTSKTNFLINNDSTSPSSKNKKAIGLGVAIITEEEFNKML